MPITNPTFEVKMTGKLTPESVPASVLGEFITLIEKAVLAVLGEHQEDHDDFALVSLTDVQTGSNWLHFSSPPTVIPAVGVITTAIHERDYSRLPIKAHEYIYEANKICHRHHWGLEFLPNDKYSIVGAQIEAGEIIPPPRRSVKSKGTTTIIGRVIKTGGIDPKVHIQRLNSKESFHIAVTEDQAKELAGRLYDVVVLNCDVSWSTDDWEIDRASLKVTSVGEYAKPRSPGRAFARLRELSGSNWDNFDVSNMINDEDGEGVLN